MNISNQQFFIFCYSVLYIAYLVIYGIPKTVLEVLYGGVVLGVVFAFIVGVFLLTLLVFGLPIPDIFKRKK